jgi:hypothetical protein
VSGGSTHRGERGPRRGKRVPRRRGTTDSSTSHNRLILLFPSTVASFPFLLLMAQPSSIGGRLHQQGPERAWPSPPEGAAIVAGEGPCSAVRGAAHSRARSPERRSSRRGSRPSEFLASGAADLETARTAAKSRPGHGKGRSQGAQRRVLEHRVEDANSFFYSNEPMQDLASTLVSSTSQHPPVIKLTRPVST